MTRILGILMGTSKKPHLVLDSDFSAATALSKCLRSPVALRFCRLVSTKNFFVNFLKLFLRGALILIAVGLGAQEEDALLFYRQGRYSEAVRICLKELEERGRDQAKRRMDSYSVLGWSYLRLGSYEKALTSARQAREEIRYDIRIIEIEAEALYYMGRTIEALALFEEYVSLSTNTQAARIGSVYYFMGEIFIRLEEYHHADIAITTALYHNPHVAQWWARLGYAKEQSLDTEGARTAYARALELQPSMEDARTGIERLGG